MIGLGECMQCKMKRLQEESDREFKKRYGMVDPKRTPLRMGWKPFLGQAAPVAPSVATSAAPVQRSYLDNVKERLGWYAIGTGFGYPIGILANVAFKSLRRYRDEAATFAGIMAGVGLLAAILPFPKSEIVDAVARVSGILTGSALADVTLPAKRTTDAIAKAI